MLIDAACATLELDVHIWSWTTTGRTKRRSSRIGSLKRPRFHVHFTPTYGSWLNLVERWFCRAHDEAECGAGRIAACANLKAAIQRVHRCASRANPKPFVWTKTADEILASIARFAERTANVQAAVTELISRTKVTGH
jgi:hypothetical protein